MQFANETHKNILAGIHDEVVRFQRNSSGKKAAYKEGWEEAMSTAESIINNCFLSQGAEDGAEEETHDPD